MRSIALLLTFLLAIPGLAFAQETTDPDVQRQKDAAELRLKQAEAELKEAEVRDKQAATKKTEAETLNQITGNFKSQVEMLKGTTTTEGEFIESSIAAYRGLACTVQPILRELSTQPIYQLVVFDPGSADQVVQYRLYLSELQRLNSQYDDLIPKNTGGNEIASITAGTAFSIGVGILSLFKTDVALKGSVIKPGQEEFFAAFTRYNSIPVVFPQMIMPNADPDKSKLIALLQALEGKYKTVSGFLVPIQRLEASIVEQTAQIKLNEEMIETWRSRIPGSTSGQAAQLRKKIRTAEDENFDIKVEIGEAKTKLNDVKPFTDKARQINARFEVIVKKLQGEKPAEGSVVGTISLSNILRAERIIASFDEEKEYTNGRGARWKGKTYWLSLNVVGAGSTMRNKTSPLIDFFKGGNRTSLNSGAIVSYRVFDNDGKTLVSNLHTSYKGFEKINEKNLSTQCPVAATAVIP